MELGDAFGAEAADDAMEEAQPPPEVVQMDATAAADSTAPSAAAAEAALGDEEAEAPQPEAAVAEVLSSQPPPEADAAAHESAAAPPAPLPAPEAPPAEAAAAGGAAALSSPEAAAAAVPVPAPRMEAPATTPEKRGVTFAEPLIEEPPAAAVDLSGPGGSQPEAEEDLLEEDELADTEDEGEYGDQEVRLLLQELLEAVIHYSYITSYALLRPYVKFSTQGKELIPGFISRCSWRRRTLLKRPLREGKSQGFRRQQEQPPLSCPLRSTASGRRRRHQQMLRQRRRRRLRLPPQVWQIGGRPEKFMLAALLNCLLVGYILKSVLWLYGLWDRKP